MSNYTCTTKTKVVSENGHIDHDGYGTIEVTNIGTDAAKINDNIPLASGDTWSIQNLPNVTIAENTGIRFAGVSEDKQVLVQMIYYKEI